MRRSSVLLASVLFLLFAGLGGFWYGSSSRSQRELPIPLPDQIIGGLAVSASDIDLGEMIESKNYTHTLPMRNMTSRPIAVKEFFVSCGCLRTYPSTVTLGPGGTRLYRTALRFDASAAGGNAPGNAPSERQYFAGSFGRSGAKVGRLDLARQDS